MGPVTRLAAGRPYVVSVDDLQARVRAELARTAGAAQVVWMDEGAELLVRCDEARVRCVDGAVLVGLPVHTEQTGDAEIVLAFALGAGPDMAAERPPRGPETIVDRWGEPLIAAVWEALLALTARAVGSDGATATNGDSRPNGDGDGRSTGTPRAVSLSASPDGLTIDAASRD